MAVGAIHFTVDDAETRSARPGIPPCPVTSWREVRVRRAPLFLDRLRCEKELNWTFLSPSALFEAGTGPASSAWGDQLPVDSAGKSWISFEDFAVVMADEIERPAPVRRRFTVGYHRGG